MSDISVSLDSIRARIVDRVAQASGTSSGPSENSNGLLPLGIEDAQAFRKALDALGAHSDSESLGLLDPRCFDGPPPKNVKRAPESGSLSDHQWRRYGEGERNNLTGAYVVAAPTSARCGVGSVKSNIGHLEPAAGLAVVVKVVAAMAHRRLLASIHVTTVSSRMSLLDDLAVSEEIRRYPDYERSTNSTGMW